MQYLYDFKLNIVAIIAKASFKKGRFFSFIQFETDKIGLKHNEKTMKIKFLEKNIKNV